VNLADWHAVLASEPATCGQVGAIHGECQRLGLTDRAERLAVTATLLGLDGLDSTRDLVMGDAGRLVRMLSPGEPGPDSGPRGDVG
jgi:hypothetical protein